MGDVAREVTQERELREGEGFRFFDPQVGERVLDGLPQEKFATMPERFAEGERPANAEEGKVIGDRQDRILDRVDQQEQAQRHGTAAVADVDLHRRKEGEGHADEGQERRAQVKGMELGEARDPKRTDHAAEREDGVKDHGATTGRGQERDERPQ